MKRTCGNCRFYDGAACHRFPPVNDDGVGSWWWCGEHRFAWRTVWESIRVRLVFC